MERHNLERYIDGGNETQGQRVIQGAWAVIQDISLFSFTKTFFLSLQQRGLSFENEEGEGRSIENQKQTELSLTQTCKWNGIKVWVDSETNTDPETVKNGKNGFLLKKSFSFWRASE